jgi:hypothetical protein
MNNPQNKQSFLKIPHYKLLAIIALATLISWAALTLVILKLDPYASTDLALSFFYLSAFISLTGTFTILLFLLKKWRAQDKVYLKHVTISLRQGFLLSGCTTICIALLMLGLLRVWNGLLLVAIMTFAEFYFSSKDELD